MLKKFENFFETIMDIAKNQITLLIITDTRVTGLGGSEKHIRFLLDSLPGNRYKIFLSELQGLDESKISHDIIDVISDKNVAYIKQNVKRIYGLGACKAFWNLHKLLRNESVDIVISFHEKSDIINSLLKLIHGIRFKAVSSRRDMGICPSNLLLKMRALLVKNMDYLIAPAQSIITAAVDKGNYPLRQTRVIRNGIDTHDCPNHASAIPRDIESLVAGRICGVCVANLKPVKGHSYLIDAFKVICLKYPESILLFIGGDSGSGESIRSKIDDLSLQDNILILGKRTDVPAILQYCHYMVSSSLSEGLSNALLEGLAAGLPIVASNTGGNPEIVIDGHNGFLYEPCNSEQLAACLMKLTTDVSLRKKFGLASSERARRIFSNERVIKEYDSFFKQCCN